MRQILTWFLLGFIMGALLTRPVVIDFFDHKIEQWMRAR